MNMKEDVESMFGAIPYIEAIRNSDDSWTVSFDNNLYLNYAMGHVETNNWFGEYHFKEDYEENVFGRIIKSVGHWFREHLAKRR
jgi:hypothetical protein